MRHLQGAVEINTVPHRRHAQGGAGDGGAAARRRALPTPTFTCFSPAPARAIWSRACAAPARASRSCCSRTLDVVEARREDWSTDPFKLIEKDGYFYGRGSGDDKYMAAAFVANLIRYKQEGFSPTATSSWRSRPTKRFSTQRALGIQWLLKNHRDLIDAEFALNEGGGVGLQDGKPLSNSCPDQRESLDELPARA